MRIKQARMTAVVCKNFLSVFVWRYKTVYHLHSYIIVRVIFEYLRTGNFKECVHNNVVGIMTEHDNRTERNQQAKRKVSSAEEKEMLASVVISYFLRLVCTLQLLPC